MSDTNGTNGHNSTTTLATDPAVTLDGFEDEYDGYADESDDYAPEPSIPTSNAVSEDEYAEYAEEVEPVAPTVNNHSGVEEAIAPVTPAEPPIEPMEEEEEEPESLNPQDYQPKKSLVDHALAKPVFLGGVGLVVVIIAGITVNNIMGGGSKPVASVPSPSPSETPAAAEEQATTQEGKLRSELAFAGQTVQNEQALRATQGTPTPQATPAPAPTTPPMPEPVAQSSVPMPPPVLPQEPVEQAAPTQPSFQELYTQMSPVERWQIAAQSGSFGSAAVTPPTQRVQEPPSMPFSQRPGNVPSSNPPIAQSPISRGNVLVGTKADASLETAIVLASDNSVSNDMRYLVRLTSPLKDTENRIVIPAGTVLVATVRGFSPQTGTVQLAAQSFIQDNQEKSLPTNSVLIRASNGGTLTARREGGRSNVGRSLLPALFSGVAQAAQTINEPRSSITVNGGSTITSNSGNRNIGAAFTGGAFRNLTEQLQQQAQAAQQQAQANGGQIWRIAEGQSVQVFVNSSFSL